MRKTTLEEVDPMMSDKSFGMDVFFEHWSANLADKEGWDWTEFKAQLSQKGADKVWFVVKSVDTLTSEDGGAPWVPNFIIFETTKEAFAAKQAPRFRMKPATRDENMDPEAFISDDIVDMKGLYEWRQLDGHADIYVLCGKGEKTDKLKPKFDFGNQGGFGSFAAPAGGAAPAFTFGATTPSAAPDFTFGTSTASAAPAFTFGTTTPSAAPEFTFGTSTASAAPAFTFGTTTPSAAPAFTFGTSTASAAAPEAAPEAGRKRKADEAVEEGEAEAAPAAKKAKVDAPTGDAPMAAADAPMAAAPEAAPEEYVPPTEDVVFPILFTLNVIEDKRDEMAQGMKVILDYKAERDGVAVDYKGLKVENDLVFLKEANKKHIKTVRGLIDKQILKREPRFLALREEYMGDNVVYDAKSAEAMQEEYMEKRQALLDEDDINQKQREIYNAHGTEITKLLNRICRARNTHIVSQRDLLTLLMRDVKAKQIFSRDEMRVLRYFPEKDSKGAAFAFRPSTRINKSVGKADFCYPKEFVNINPFTGKPM